MASRPKQATVALNLCAIAAVVLLYVVEKMSPDAVTPEVRPTPSMAASQSVKLSPPAPVKMAGIKVVNSPLPAPPPRPVKTVQQSEKPASPTLITPPAIDDSQPLPTAKLQLVSISKAPQTPKPALHPLTADRQTPPTKPVLTSALAGSKAAMPPQKVAPKLTKSVLSPQLPAVKLTALTPLKTPTETPVVPTTAQRLNPAILSTMLPPQKDAQQTPQQTPRNLSEQSKVKGEVAVMADQSNVARPPEIRIQQASLLHGQKTLDKVVSKGGLDMEIFWPPSSQQSAYLYRVMTRCFGMQSAVINSKGDLFLASGQMSANNRSLSPLLRQLKQPASRAEHRVIQQIVTKNTIAAGYQPVRIFARSVDARLVDGVATLTGRAIHPQSVVRANYVIDQGRVYIANITHDGVPSNGRVLLTNGGC